MIIGHAPAGYIISRLLLPCFKVKRLSAKTFLWVGVIGALAPDIDMLYFHLIDQRQHHHHTYVTHFPILWLTLLICSVIWFSIAKNKGNAALATLFSINGLIHMVFDTIVGDIWWFAPFIDKPFVFFTVPALYTPWWLNFLLHGSFGIEVTITIFAFYLWRKRPSSITTG
jgi:inner membrane protein